MLSAKTEIPEMKDPQSLDVAIRGALQQMGRLPLKKVNKVILTKLARSGRMGQNGTEW